MPVLFCSVFCVSVHCLRVEPTAESPDPLSPYLEPDGRLWLYFGCPGTVELRGAPSIRRVHRVLARLHRMFRVCVLGGLRACWYPLIVWLVLKLWAAVQVQLYQNSDVMFHLRSLGFLYYFFLLV